MRKSIVITALSLFVVIVFALSRHHAIEARGRYGSIRIGGINSHGLGSHYIGGYVRSGPALRWHYRPSGLYYHRGW
jgi:hypothetical protein